MATAVWFTSETSVTMVTVDDDGFVHRDVFFGGNLDDEFHNEWRAFQILRGRYYRAVSRQEYAAALAVRRRFNDLDAKARGLRRSG